MFLKINVFLKTENIKSFKAMITGNSFEMQGFVLIIAKYKKLSFRNF